MATARITGFKTVVDKTACAIRSSWVAWLASRLLAILWSCSDQKKKKKEEKLGESSFVSHLTTMKRGVLSPPVRFWTSPKAAHIRQVRAAGTAVLQIFAGE